MIRTSRKVEMAAAACYAGSFALWVLGSDYRAFEPEFGPEGGLKVVIYEMERASTLMEGWAVGCLALLTVAVGLTFAAIRLRRSSEQNPRYSHGEY